MSTRKPTAKSAAASYFAAEGIAHAQRVARAPSASWIDAQTELARKLAVDEEPADAPVAPAGAPIVFLDIDDVVCLCQTVGGLEALACVTAERFDHDVVYGVLLHPPAVDVLRQMHEQMGGRVRYVISSTWRAYFNRAQLRHVLRQSGLGFAADCMEGPTRWATPRFKEHDRRREIGAWLALHHRGEPYAVIDDALSGASLPSSSVYQLRVALCDGNVGLEKGHLAGLLRALRTPPRQEHF